MSRYKYRCWPEYDNKKPSVIVNNRKYTSIKCAKKTSLNSIKLIYKFLNHGTSGMVKFLDMLKAKYPDALHHQGDSLYWEFDPEDILREFWSDQRFIPVLEERGLDDFNRLHYWAHKEGNLF